MSRRVRIADIARTFAGGTPDRAVPSYFGGGIPWVKSAEVANSLIETTEETLTEQGLAESSAKWASAGSTLVAMYGANAAQVGRLAIRATTNQAVLCVEAKSPEDSGYLYHAVSAAASLLLRRTQGSGQPNLNAGIVRNLPVPWPAASLRRSVAHAADGLERALALLARLIERKRTFKRALMQDLLTGRRRFEEFKDSGSWTKARIGDLLEEASRPVEWDDDAEYQLVSIRRRNGGFFARETKRGNSIKTKSLFTIATGDFVVSRMQAVHGAMASVPEAFDGAHVSGMYMVLAPRSPERVLTRFLDYASHLRYMYRNVLTSCHGVHIEKMTFDPKKYLNKKVLVPPTVAEQGRIVDVLDRASHEILGLEHQLTLLSQLKRGLMQKLLSGEIAVPDRIGTPD